MDNFNSPLNSNNSNLVYLNGNDDECNNSFSVSETIIKHYSNNGDISGKITGNNINNNVFYQFHQTPDSYDLYNNPKNYIF